MSIRVNYTSDIFNYKTVEFNNEDYINIYFCKYWDKKPITINMGKNLDNPDVKQNDKESEVNSKNKDEWIVILTTFERYQNQLDISERPLGKHFIDDNGIPFGVILVDVINQVNDSTQSNFYLQSYQKKNGMYAGVNQVFCHEILEMLINPYLSFFATNGNQMYSEEICDAVTFNRVDYLEENTLLTMSDFLLPCYFDSKNNKTYYCVLAQESTLDGFFFTNPESPYDGIDFNWHHVYISQST
jgi:hypothetical protein